MAQRRNGNKRGQSKPRQSKPNPFDNKSKKAAAGNYQDEAEAKEYNKGKRAGAAAVDRDVWMNDPQWYVPNDQLLKDVASFPTTYYTGLPIQQGSAPYATQQTDTTPWNVTLTTSPGQPNPGILVLNTLHTIGAATNETDPVNQAANQLFTMQQMKSGKTPQYEAPDNMLYYLALTDAYAYYVWLVRLYGISSDFNSLNRYTPQWLIQAMGVDWNDLKGKRADFRAAINLFALQLSSFPLPKTLSYVNRRMFIYEHIFMDSANPQAQYILFNPVGFFHWHEGETDHPTTYLTLENDMITNASALKTVDQLVKYATELITPLQQSEDVRRIGADILNTYGAGSLMEILPIAETYSISPTYNEQIMTQIENAHVMLPSSVTASIKPYVQVEQATGINQSYLTASYEYFADLRQTGLATDSRPKTDGAVVDMLNIVRDNEHIINFHHQNPTPEDFMEATRLSIAPYYVAATSSTAGATIDVVIESESTAITGGPVYFGPELILGAYVFALNQNGTGITREVINTDKFFWNVGNSTWEAVNGGFSTVALLQAFDWCPKIRYNMITSPTNSKNAAITKGNYFFDQDCFALISGEEMNRLNAVAWYGLFTPKISV